MGRIVNKADYTFNKVAKTITFSSTYTGLELAQIQLITDVTNNTIIYQFNKPALGGTLAGLVLTLTYNTNTVAFNNTDDLMIIINESEDNTQLYSGTISAVGPTTAVLTTDQQTLSIQLSGTWEGIVMVEGSNDGTNYIPLMVLPVNELSLVDSITEDGIFNLTTSTKFVRLNVVQLQTGSITALILGRTIDGPNAADALSIAMDRTQNTPLTVQEVNPLKRDINSALVPSDMPDTIRINGPVTNNTAFGPIIDTIGYQSVIVQHVGNGGTVFPQFSMNGINWTGNGSFPIYQTGIQSAGSPSFTDRIGSGQTHQFSCIARYLRFVAGASISDANTVILLVTLKQSPIPLVANTAGVPVFMTAGSNAVFGAASSATASGNTTNTLSVGATYGPGTTSVPYPIIIGGRQAPQAGALNGIIRTMLMDPAGRVLLGASDQTKLTTVETPLQTISANFENGNSLSVTDLSQFEGQSYMELLAQILTEIRIMNRYMAELPRVLNSGQSTVDEPEMFRQDGTFFNL